MNKNPLLKGGMYRKAILLVMLVAIVMSIFMVPVSAARMSQDPYDTYTYWTAPGTKKDVSSAAMYEYETTITGADVGLTAFAKPTDVFVDDAGGEKIGLYANLSGSGNVLHRVVAHHDALFCLQTQLVQDLPVIVRVGLTAATVFIGGNICKILRLQPRPPDTAVGGDSREEGIGGQYNPETLFFSSAHAHRYR